MLGDDVRIIHHFKGWGSEPANFGNDLLNKFFRVLLI